jgi:acetyl-CoA carboxylase biotin carboxyl carrier protein
MSTRATAKLADSAGPRPDASAANAVPPAGVELVRVVQALLEVLDQARVTEIEVTWGATSIRARRGAPRSAPLPGPQLGEPDAGFPQLHLVPHAEPDLAMPGPAVEELVQVLSPLTGVFYLTPSPNAPLYVRERDVVERDQVLGLVEAMKIFNEIRSECAGTVVRILVQSGELVQVHQPLMLIRPHAELPASAP